MSQDFDDLEALEDGERVELYYHLIWSTAGQQPLLDDEWGVELGVYMNEVMVNNGGALLSNNGGKEHVHLLVTLPTWISLDAAVNVLKRSSERWIRKNVSGLEGFAWQEQYVAATISPWDIEHLRAYIHNQPDYHEEHSFREEIRAFLEDLDILYDEDDLWK